MNGVLASTASLSLVLAISSCAAPAVAPAASLDDKSIAQICKDQEAAWNRGDLDAFMSLGYERSESLTFFSGGSVTHGFDATLARYKKRYQTDGTEMGRLAFTQLEILPLTEDAALVRGRWDLDFEVQPDVGGLFTLLFKKTSNGWRILHDHSSSDSK